MLCRRRRSHLLQFSRPNRTADNRWTPARALWLVVTERSWKAAELSFLVRQAANHPQPKVDRRRGEMSRLQMHPVPNDHRLIEGEPWLGAIPVHEFVYGADSAAAHLGTIDY
jgi:hypothetical protein